MMIRLFRSLYKLGGNAVIQSSLDLLVQMRGDFLFSRIFRHIRPRHKDRELRLLNIIDELEWREAINQQTDAEGLRKLVQEQSIALYCGVDPTGDSMHIGHLIPFMMLKRFQLAGHKPVILIGGATGTIGDPSGRQSERSLQTMEQVQANVEALTAQMKNCS